MALWILVYDCILSFFKKFFHGKKQTDIYTIFKKHFIQINTVALLFFYSFRLPLCPEEEYVGPSS